MYYIELVIFSPQKSKKPLIDLFDEIADIAITWKDFSWHKEGEYTKGGDIVFISNVLGREDLLTYIFSCINSALSDSGLDFSFNVYR